MHLFRFKLTQNVSTMLNDRTFIDFEKKMTRIIHRKASIAFMLEYGLKDSSWNMLSEDTATVHLSMMFVRIHPLSRTFINTIDRLITSGVAQELDEISLLTEVSLKHDDLEAPQPLTMDQLGVCFIFILVCLGLSCIAFIIECITSFL